VAAFADWQAQYAEAGIITFPVRDKRPAVRNYLKLGKQGSSRLVSRFPDADEFGFSCRPSGICVVDVDTRDERILAHALDTFGPTRLIARTGSGNFQAWYRNNGEGRRIRLWPDLPIDVLGHGQVVAPPSIGRHFRYEFIEGCLADVRELPVMKPDVLAPGTTSTQGDNHRSIPTGRRNDTLWRACMAQAKISSNIDELAEFAGELNLHHCREPLTAAEVHAIVLSAWKYQTSGRNWFGDGGVQVVAHEEVDGLLSDDPDGFLLLTILRRHHWGSDEFVVANAMHEIMPEGGWRRERFTAARKRLEERGEIVLVAARGWRRPATYKFKSAQK
jgi:hypothetical protein